MRDRLQLMERLELPARAMLEIHSDPVKPGEGNDLGGNRRSQVEESPSQNLAAGSDAIAEAHGRRGRYMSTVAGRATSTRRHRINQGHPEAGVVGDAEDAFGEGVSARIHAIDAPREPLDSRDVPEAGGDLRGIQCVDRAAPGVR